MKVCQLLMMPRAVGVEHHTKRITLHREEICVPGAVIVMPACLTWILLLSIDLTFWPLCGPMHEMSGSVHPCRCLMDLTSLVQAHVAPVRSLEDVERVMATLLTNGKIARATHNIMAYRIAVTDKDTVLQVLLQQSSCFHMLASILLR